MIVGTQNENQKKSIPNFELGDVISIEWEAGNTEYYLVTYATTISTNAICLRNLDGLTYVCKHETISEIKEDLEKSSMFKIVKVFSANEYKLIIKEK